MSQHSIVQHDVIIVLGCGVKADGSLSDIAQSRVNEAVRLFKQGKAAHILFSGKQSYKKKNVSGKTEAQAMKEFALAQGVDENKVFKEEESLDTIGNAYFSRLLVLDKQRWKSFIVVTSPFHVERAMYVFKKVFGPEYTIEFASGISHVESRELEVRAKAERSKIELTKEHLDKIEDGDDAAIGKWMYTQVPWYWYDKESGKRAPDYWDEL